MPSLIRHNLMAYAHKKKIIIREYTTDDLSGLISHFCRLIPEGKEPVTAISYGSDEDAALIMAFFQLLEPSLDFLSQPK